MELGPGPYLAWGAKGCKSKKHKLKKAQGEPGFFYSRAAEGKTVSETQNETTVPIDQTRDLSLPREENGRAASSQLPDAFPFRFGQYEILEELGRGGMGVVYKGIQKDLDRLVSIKMILSNRLLSWRNVARFEVEAKAAARVRHPNIVGIYEAGRLHNQYFIAMEYIEGESLAQRLRKSRLQPREAAQILISIASAIEHLHSRGIIHLDLKPSNILMDQSGQPYVTDFGLARGLGGENPGNHGNLVSGTPCYMAPEQARGDKEEIGPCSDVYGLGAILYELLSGHPPFKREDPLETLLEVVEGEPKPLQKRVPGIPDPIARICRRCLEKCPENRYPSPGALIDDLERFLAGDVVESSSPSLLSWCRCWMRREPALSSHLIVLALFYGIELLWYHLFKIRTASYHYTLMAILTLWGISMPFFHRLLMKRPLRKVASFAWAGSDVLFLTAALLNSTGVSSYLLILYPILLAASGLWFRSALVWFVTGVSLASYGFLIFYASLFRPEQQLSFDRYAVFLLALFSIGFLIALLVRRVELLMGYCRGEPKPSSMRFKRSGETSGRSRKTSPSLHE